ncbi:MAG TPA: type I restriction-modification system subunit M [Agitococcus sp.]|nr:type I restriction-modification system subunit M [Agitococcus sp.]
MAIKKSALYSSLWRGCDELRGGMDASQYKDYVLVLLFLKYVSDKYADLDPDDADIVIPKGSSFADMVALKGDKEIGDKINKHIIAPIAEANNLKGIIDVTDFNAEEKLGKDKEMVDRLTKLIAIFEGLDFSSNRAEGDDLLGDAYEYLMRHFATESGKSKGQFYTPAEVSRVIAKIIGVNTATLASQTIYDPTCGSASLLLKAHDEAQVDISIYGQEMDNATAALAKMNMILHGCSTADIVRGNTLSNPAFLDKHGQLKTFDFAVANPPFSTKAWRNGFLPEEDSFNRFAYGIPPDKNGDYAFLLHILSSLNSTGKGAVILPHGVLFRGNAEADIRKTMITQGYIKGIIGLPANLFYGTGIPACIIVLDKENATARKGIFMVDASKGFSKDGNKNRLRHQDIHKIVDVFTKQLELPKYSRLVAVSEIEANEYNLNIPRYIDSSEAEDLQNIEAHLLGGIPHADIDDLARYWQVLPSLRSALFAPTTRPLFSQLTVAIANIKSTIFSHAEFTAFNNNITALFNTWRSAHLPMLQGLTVGCHPKTLIQTLSESLLTTFKDAPLLDNYDIYQHLMTYWDDVFQDDVYLISAEGWQAVLDNKPNEDLIPKPLIIARYFAAQQTNIEQLEANRDAITRQMEELDEEHGGDDGLLADAKNDKGSVNKASLKMRLTAIKHDASAHEERQLLNQYAALIEQQATANKAIKDAQKALDVLVHKQYFDLDENAVKTLVINDKWLSRLAADVQSELDRVSQALTGRIKQLAERYETPLPLLSQELEGLSAKVDEHLKKMGFVW